MDTATQAQETPTVAALLERLCVAQEETNRLLKNQHKEWLNSEETAEMLGINISKGGRHKRVLKFARDHHHLTVFGSRGPYTYSRKEVENLQRKILAGQVYLS